MTTTQALTADLTVATIVERHPATQAIFARHGIDLCCGGGKSLLTVAQAHGLDLAALLNELGAAIG